MHDMGKKYFDGERSEAKNFVKGIFSREIMVIKTTKYKN